MRVNSKQQTKMSFGKVVVRLGVLLNADFRQAFRFHSSHNRISDEDALDGFKELRVQALACGFEGTQPKG